MLAPNLILTTSPIEAVYGTKLLSPSTAPAGFVLAGILFSITLSSKLNTVPALNVAVPLNTNDVPLILTTVILFKLFPGSVTIAPTLISSFDAVSVTFVEPLTLLSTVAVVLVDS